MPDPVEQNELIQLRSTLGDGKVPFEPLLNRTVKMYVCGPTVYSDAHIGHAMSAIVFDVVRRYLEYRGYEVKHVMNFTDVDDKIIARAAERHVDPFELANGYIQEFQNELAALNVLKPHIMPRVSTEIGNIISFISKLVEKGAAYSAANGDVYFSVATSPEYGKLSRRHVETEAPVEATEAEGKKNTADFALWKAAKPGEPCWESPWGKGRPGWHIECSAMAYSHLGEQIDIHGGGNDLVFPHHENEIAQTEGLTGKAFSKYWMHNGMLQFAGDKMSKSIGNLVTIKEFLKAHDANALRMVVLNSKYSSPLAFSAEIVGQAETSLDRLRTAANKPSSVSEAPLAAGKASYVFTARFIEAMNDDFNTPRALAVIFDLARTILRNQEITKIDDDIPKLQQTLVSLCSVLGIDIAGRSSRLTNRPTPSYEKVIQAVSQVKEYFTDCRNSDGLARLEKSLSAFAGAANVEDLEPIISAVLELRQTLRSQRNWVAADRVRDALKLIGISIKDTGDKVTWKLD